MIGTGLMLILVLSYAVYSNTADSEYYGYTTTNDSLEMELQMESEDKASWYYTTKAAITWINVSVDGAPNDGSTLVVEAEGIKSEWYYSPHLGLDSAINYVCNEPKSDYSDIMETCSYQRSHSMELNDGSGIMRGRVSLDLPIEGVGYLENENISEAKNEAREKINSQNKTITWRISVESEGQTISSDGIEVSAVVTTHEFVGIEQFRIDPVQETIYSFATLVGCFFLLLIIPLMAYFSVTYKERRNERIRLSVSEE
jgi:hypothetical protein